MNADLLTKAPITGLLRLVAALLRFRSVLARVLLRCLRMHSKVVTDPAFVQETISISGPNAEDASRHFADAELYDHNLARRDARTRKDTWLARSKVAFQAALGG